jgi:hypothetical protein
MMAETKGSVMAQTTNEKNTAITFSEIHSQNAAVNNRYNESHSKSEVVLLNQTQEDERVVVPFYLKNGTS